MSKAVLLHNVIKTLVKEGTEVSIDYCRKKECIYYNLNTGLKSHIHLYLLEGVLLADVRYGEPVVINCLEDLLRIYFYWLEDAESRGWGTIILPTSWEVLANSVNYPIPTQFQY